MSDEIWVELWRCPKCNKMFPSDILERRANKAVRVSQLHPVDRLDGDNPDGNPGPIALHGEAINVIEEDARMIFKLCAEQLGIKNPLRRDLENCAWRIINKCQAMRIKEAKP